MVVDTVKGPQADTAFSASLVGECNNFEWVSSHLPPRPHDLVSFIVSPTNPDFVFNPLSSAPRASTGPKLRLTNLDMKFRGIS